MISLASQGSCLDFLAEITGVCKAGHQYERVFHFVVDRLSRLYKCRTVAIVLIDRKTEYLHVENHVGLYLPGAVDEQGFNWDLLCGGDGQTGSAALATQHVSVNIDPSDRYAQAVPGSDQHRLRPDESGYDNLVLAGDWTDCGWNAGCIEAAVMSGLQAANALLGRGRFYRIRGWYMP
jgi:hypothetical protein